MNSFGQIILSLFYFKKIVLIFFNLKTLFRKLIIKQTLKSQLWVDLIFHVKKATWKIRIKFPDTIAKQSYRKFTKTGNWPEWVHYLSPYTNIIEMQRGSPTLVDQNLLNFIPLVASTPININSFSAQSWGKPLEEQTMFFPRKDLASSLRLRRLGSLSRDCIGSAIRPEFDKAREVPKSLWESGHNRRVP